LNRDPIAEVGGINLYRFVGNSPLNRIDLFGFAGAEEDEEDIEREEPIFGERDPKETEIESVIAYENEENEDVMKEYEDSERETAIEARTPESQGSEGANAPPSTVTSPRRVPCPGQNVFDNAPSGFSNFKLGQSAHEDFQSALNRLYNTESEDWLMRTSPGQNGIDATYIGPENNNPGFNFAELKPYSQSGIDSFGDQLEDWGLPKNQTQLFFYNKGGIIGSSGFNF
jgi:hypothetical protein